MSSLYVGLSTGNVGIGTSSVTRAKTHISHTGTGDIFRVDDEASETTPFVIDANGNVGIGMTTPLNKCVIAGALQVNSYILTNGYYSISASVTVLGNTATNVILTSSLPNRCFVTISNFDGGPTNGLWYLDRSAYSGGVDRVTQIASGAGGTTLSISGGYLKATNGAGNFFTTFSFHGLA